MECKSFKQPFSFYSSYQRPSYQCATCNRTFLRKFYLRKHIFKNHLASFHCTSALPDNLEYVSKRTEPSGTLKITLNTTDINVIHRWIQDFGSLNNAVYVRTNLKRNKNKTTVYYEQNRCQHYYQPKNENRKKRTKGRKCTSCVLVSVKTTNVTEMTVRENHSHPLATAEILHYRTPSEAAKRQFEELFNSGLSPTAAYNKFIDETKANCGSNSEWLKIHCDRSKVPDLPWVHKFFSKKVKEKYGDQGSYEQAIVNLKNYLTDKYDFCRFKELKDGFVIAIHTPLMRRVSNLSTAGELLFIDSVGGVDKHGFKFKVFPLIVSTDAGGCPVGVLITTGEAKEVISEGLALYLTFVDEQSFGGRGKQGPQCIITGDCQAEIQALKEIFPETILHLCIFHFMKAVYRWLFNSKNGVVGKDRLLLFDLTKKMVYAESEEKLLLLYSTLSKIPSGANMKVKNYFQKECERRYQWALCYRYVTDVITHDCYTNNYAEQTTRIIKDEILNRRVALCPNQLVDYFTKAYDDRYKCTLIDASINENCRPLKRKSSLDTAEFEENYQVNKVMENIFEILKTKQKIQYYVDAEIGCCSCHIGINGGLCKHIRYVTSQFAFTHLLLFSNSSIERQQLYYIATGERVQEVFPVSHEDEHYVSDFEVDVEIQDDSNEKINTISNQDSAINFTTNMNQISFAFSNFIDEVNSFWKKFEGRADVAEGLNQAAMEFRKLQNGTAARAVSALKCFNRNLSY